MGTMIMTLLDHYIYLFHKQPDILINLMGIDFESKATYGDDDGKYINKKIETYKDSITTNIYDKTGFKEVPEEKIPHVYQ